MEGSYWSLVMGGGILLVPGDGGDGEGGGVHVEQAGVQHLGTACSVGW